MKKLLILDSNSILNRAYYGIRFLSASDGTPTNAIYGFLNILFKLINEEKPDFVCGAFDLKAPTFRHKMYGEYKAGRKPMPDDLKVQMPYAREILTAMGVPVLEIEGYEADDIIGTVSAICDKENIKCLIATGDKDDLQLVSDNTNVILTVSRMGKSETVCYGIKEVKEKYNVTPTEFIDVKALMGDPSDNIPGVAGIGEKTATKLIADHHSIEALYENIENSGVKGATLQKLKDGEESARLSKELATICRSVPIEFDVQGCAFKEEELSEREEFIKLLERLELNSFIKKLGGAKKAVTNFFENQKAAKTIEELGNRISCVIKRSGKAVTAAAFSNGKAVYSVYGGESEKVLKSVLEDNTKEVYMFNMKEDYVALSEKFEFLNIKADLAIGAYLLNPSKSEYTVFGALKDYIGAEPPEEKESNTQMSLFDDEPKADDTLEKMAFSIIPIWEVMEKELKDKALDKLFYDVEMPLVFVLGDMEKEGITVDIAELEKFGSRLETDIGRLTEEIYSLAGEEFNINSPKQLGPVLFERLELKPAKKTKTGYATGAEVLEKLRGKHPVIEKILEYRQLTKLKSTYCDGLAAVVNKETGKIHSMFNQTVTVTGRLSSAEPNLQNIPVRTALGREIRKMFIAGEGNVLLDADYSQIELRILAHLSGDKVMTEAYKNGDDIHSVTAAQVFDVPLEEVTSKMRSFAKTVNFGIVYGMGEFSLAQDLKISIAEAKKYIANYKARYSGMNEYLEATKEKAKEDGFVRTLYGRVRYIPELRSPNFNIRSFGERAASNAPIQGTAADIIKIAMVRVYKRLKEEGLRSKLILQVHDELILEVPEDEISKAETVLREEMENAATLSVPLAVEMAHGKSWYDAK